MSGQPRGPPEPPWVPGPHLRPPAVAADWLYARSAGFQAAARMAEILSYAVLADQLGLDVFALGEHHSAEFFTSSPAVVLAAAAASTSRIRLTSATTLLGVADPVRVYEDFASLDLISRGRAEVIAGRSAFVEPFALFGYDTADYDALFAEKLGLLLDIRARENVTWTGRFRPPLHEAAVVPRALQQPLPVWVGVGGSSDSAERACRLGLPMVLGYIGGTPSARPRRRRRRHECSRNCARRRQPRKILNRQLNRELSGALWFRER